MSKSRGWTGSQRFRHVGSVVIAVALAVFAMACGTTTSPTTTSSVTVTGTAPIVGASSQFTATATMSDGTTQNVTAQATWQSSDPATVTVSSGGLVTAIAEGVASVTATYQTVAGSSQITVVQ